MDVLNPKEQVEIEELSASHRLLIIVVPEDVPDRFVAQLTTWCNFILDTRLPLPVPLPVTRKGDGLTCPFCKGPATGNPLAHAEDCDWREAILRWGGAQLQIEHDFPVVD